MNKPAHLKHVSEGFFSQLGKFIAPDQYYILWHKGVDEFNEALEIVRRAFDDVEKRAKDDPSAFIAWMHDETNALVTPSVLQGPSGDTYVFKNKDGENVGVAVPGEIDRLYDPGGGIERGPERWAKYATRKAAEYFIYHRMRGPNLPNWGTPTVNPLIILDDVAAPDPIEEAVGIARKLTAPDAEGRKDYRLQRYEEGKPNLPTALVQAVAHRMGKPNQTARRYLIRGGFRLPDDLSWVVTQAPPGRKAD